MKGTGKVTEEIFDLGSRVYVDPRREEQASPSMERDDSMILVSLEEMGNGYHSLLMTRRFSSRSRCQTDERRGLALGPRCMN
jgi:hypothetical protein